VTLAKSLAFKDPTILGKIWELCGFRTRKEFEDNFKLIHGESFKDFISNL